MLRYRKFPFVALTFLLASGVHAGEAKPKCTSSAQECERAIRQMLSGRRYLGAQLVEANPGLAVKAVVDNGPANQADLRPGDRLMAVNGKDTRDATIKDFKDILADARETGVLWIIVQRRGILKHIEVRMQPYSRAQIDKIVAQHLAEFHTMTASNPAQR